jgi:hypothetical protein
VITQYPFALSIFPFGLRYRSLQDPSIPQGEREN